MNKVYQKIIFGLIFFGTYLFGFSITLADTCPSQTTVDGTQITFVGGIADMGGDTQISAWFEFGTASGNYTQKTEKKIISQTGKYCVIVPNLLPCTTYYYRAVMENKAGESYGAEQAKTTACPNSSTSAIVLSTPSSSSAISTEKQVLGVETQIPTGLSKNIFNEFGVFISLFIFLFLIFILKNHLIKFEVINDNIKKTIRNLKTKKF